MKEMIERLIADGWEWVAKEADTGVYLFEEKPINEGHLFFEKTGTRKLLTLHCLFPEITFENSPVELKTLLVDDEEETKEQELIKTMIEDGYEYIVLSHNNQCLAVIDDLNFSPWSDLQHQCKGMFEKVYLKDLVKKRKVKKSVWLFVDSDGDYVISKAKPERTEKGEWGLNSLKFTYLKNKLVFEEHSFTKEDEPIELTYEVEE